MKRHSSRQLKMFKSAKSAFGGSLMTTRAGRRGHRPLSTRTTMHLVLRSSKAVGEMSFRKPANAKRITAILDKFSSRYGVRIFSFANVGNHLHIHLKLGNRYAYKAYIRAITSAIAMAVTGRSRWHKGHCQGKFWDYRPFTRIIESLTGFLRLKDYVEINQWEGRGYSRREARLFLVEKEFIRRGFWSTA